MEVTTIHRIRNKQFKSSSNVFAHWFWNDVKTAGMFGWSDQISAQTLTLFVGSPVKVFNAWISNCKTCLPKNVFWGWLDKEPLLKLMFSPSKNKRQDGQFSVSGSGGLCLQHGKTCPGGAGLSAGGLDLMVIGFSCKSNSAQPLGRNFLWRLWTVEKVKAFNKSLSPNQHADICLRYPIALC